MIRTITAEINDEGYFLTDEDWSDVLDAVRALLKINFMKEDFEVRSNR